jgi:ectoine hydroxylase-related dioxygenase (phytanoyl-CoA dioxygenase family)
MSYSHPFNWTPAPYTIFKNEDLRQQVEEKGYAIVDFLDQQIVEEIKGIYQEEHRIDAESGGMFYSVYSQDVEYRERVHTKLKDRLKTSFETHFKDYNNGLNFFINKLTGQDSSFAIHQDSSAIDETKYSALSVWMPLQDVDESNGALWLIEKTHKLFSPFRSVSFSPPFSEIKDTLRDYLKPIRLKAGQALFFDSRVVHTSGRNDSGQDRIAVVSGLLPLGTSFQLSYQESPEAPIELYRQADDFLINYPHFFHNCVLRPTIGEKIGEAPFIFPKISASTFEKNCADLGIEKVNLYKDEELSQVFITEPTYTNVPLKKSTYKPHTEYPKEEFRIFKDDEKERQLCENGYVIMPFFTEEEVVELLAYFNENHHPEGDRIYAMSHSDDIEFKTGVNQWIQDTYAAHVAEHMVDVSILGGTILSKSPGTGQINPHRDWNLVNEERFRSCNAWVPLIDTTIENGAIQFLPKSHLIRPLYRAINGNHSEDDQLRFVEDFLWHNMEPTPMKAGHAFIYDHRLIHASRDNNSDIVRPAMACVITPKNAEQRLYYVNETPNGKRFEEYNLRTDHLLRDDRFEVPDASLRTRTFDYDTGYYDESHFDGLGLSPLPKEEPKIEKRRNSSILHRLRSLIKM